MRTRIGLLVLGLVLVGLRAAAEGSGPGAVEAVLDGYRTERALTAFFGSPPTRCAPATYTSRLCEWVLGNRDDAWRPMADAIATSDRVGVLCALPKGDGERVGASCTGHPRRSNRAHYRVGKRTTRSASERAARKRAIEELGAEAAAELEKARTLLALSRLLGAVPSSCHAVDEAEQLCTWRLSAHEQGHGTVAASIGADLSKKVRLRCRLPRDGSARSAGSCSAQVGA